MVSMKSSEEDSSNDVRRKADSFKPMKSKQGLACGPLPRNEVLAKTHGKRNITDGHQEDDH